MYFCEYLPRLQTVSITVDFKGAADDIKRVGLSNDNLRLVLADDKDEDLRLPRAFDACKLSSIKKNDSTLSIKLQTEQESFEESFMNMSLVEAQLWSVKDLLQKTPKNKENFNEFQFTCADCKRGVIDSLKFTKFNDMPSELWAEMMDFWHCHKPHNNAKNTKDYNGNLQPQKNSVIVGNCYLLIQNQIDVTIEDNVVFCKCGKKLGILTEDHNVKLFKWNLLLSYENTEEKYPSYLYAYNMILDRVNLDAKRKFRAGQYVIWVFNIGLNVAFTSGVLRNALKVLYYKDEKTAVKQTSTKQNEFVVDEDSEVLHMDEEILESLIEQLHFVNGSLPLDSRKVSIKEDNKPKVYEISYLGLYI